MPAVFMDLRFLALGYATSINSPVSEALMVAALGQVLESCDLQSVEHFLLWVF